MALSNAVILASLAPNVIRVQVTDEFGKVKYKKVADICDLDTISLNGAGQPVVMTGKPGRRAKPVMQAANDKVAEMLRAKELAVDEDELLDVIKHNPEGSTVLDHVMAGMAEEAASLSFERTEAERKGESTSQISMRRINALKAVGDTWIKRKEQIANGGVDMDSPAFRRLFQFIMDTFRIVLEEDLNTRPEMIETTFTALARRLDDDWKRDATKKMSEG
jgi:hypothetical protein